MTYVKCEGIITDANAGALECSTGWLVVDEPTFTLVTQEQAGDLIVAIALLWGLGMVFKLLYNLMGVQR